MALFNLPKMYWKCKRCTITTGHDVYVSYFGELKHDVCPTCGYAPTYFQFRGNNDTTRSSIINKYLQMGLEL